MPVLESALLSFFYEENPLFGEKILDSPEVAVFHRSKIPKPYYYPSTYNYSGEGIIFAGYQALGSFKYPLIFCHHRFRLDDRERNSFYKMDIVKVINEVVNHISPEAAVKILYIFKNLWYRYPQKKYDFESWFSIINKLVRIISHSSEQTRLWRERNPDLLVACSVKRKDIPRHNLRRQALNWLSLVTTGDKITPREIEYSFKLLFDDRTIKIMAYNLSLNNSLPTPASPEE
jgi:hypothetical protein